MYVISVYRHTLSFPTSAVTSECTLPAELWLNAKNVDSPSHPTHLLLSTRGSATPLPLHQLICEDKCPKAYHKYRPYQTSE